MSMSKKRKNLQDKLRRKHKWHTNADYGRGVMLEKLDATTHLRTMTSEQWTTDIHCYISGYDVRRSLLGKKNTNEVNFELVKYKPLNDGYEELARLYASMSFEELELLYNIAKEAREEIKEEIKEEMNHVKT